MIILEQVSKNIGFQPILSDITLQISAGEFISILGPNGAGKTTFLRLLAALTRPSSGRLCIAGYRLPQQADQVRKLIAYMGHESQLYGNLTA